MYSQQTKTSDDKNRFSPAASSSTAQGLQCKLDIGSVNDPLEDEADEMADRVMRMPDIPLVQRKCAGCEEEEKLQQKPLAASITPFIQRKISEGGTASDAVTSQINASKGGGSSMDTHTQSFMQSRFGVDFSDVKIHTNGEAIQMNRELNARAFTVDKDIYFNEGQYNPNSDSGKHLLAHELTHTVQQRAGIAQRTIQRISVTNTHPSKSSPCGGFTRSFIFTLDNPAPTDGYMVQKIQRYDNEVRCPGMGQCPANPSLTFFEAFFVQAGSTSFYRQAALGVTDQSGHSSRPNTAGARYAHGEIRFFPIAVTGNLGRNNRAGLWRPGNAGGVAPSLSLPSTTSEPTWWNSHTEGPVKRYVNADWRCCNDSSDFNTLSFVP